MTPSQQNRIEGVRKSCKAAAKVMEGISRFISVGLSTMDIADHASQAMLSLGCRSAFLGYHGFPGSVCISVNDEILHGIPSSKTILEGDVVKIDLGVVLDGFYSDTAETFLVGQCSPDNIKLVEATRKALHEGIKAAVEGNTNLDISKAIESSLSLMGFVPVEDMVGHGVGEHLHESPEIPNRVDLTDVRTVELKAGMTLAIEPMVGMGKPLLRIRNDGWTVVMADGGMSAHCEHTVLVTEGDPEILTLRNIEVRC